MLSWENACLWLKPPTVDLASSTLLLLLTIPTSVRNCQIFVMPSVTLNNRCFLVCIVSVPVMPSLITASHMGVFLLLSWFSPLLSPFCLFHLCSYFLILWGELRYYRGVEKAMAPHSSTLAWKIPWMEEPGRLQSMRSLRVRHDWVTSLSLFAFMHWRRKWQPTPVFLPGESQGWGSLVGCRLWGRTESDTTEAT